MKEYKGKNWKLYNGNMLDMINEIDPCSIDSIVTDPPYELNFMNKGWDNSGIAFRKETWEKCFEVLKPGGYLLAFGGSRTFHRIAVAIEDAGFEIRDTIMWLYGSGFPKSMSLGKCIESKILNGSANVKDIKNLDGVKISVTGGWNENEVEQGKRSANYEQTKTIVDYKTHQGKQWQNWGTALKPAYEPIIVARKPCEGTCVDNVLKWGVGGINIDECRVGNPYKYKVKESGFGDNFMDDNWQPSGKEYEKEVNGRFPANTILTYDETDFDEVCGGFPYTVSSGGSGEKSKINTFSNTYNGGWGHEKECSHLGGLGDSGSAARYFYCAKASKRDRDEGLDEFEDKVLAYSNQAQAELKRGSKLKGGGMNDARVRKNIHPTVKPTSLMQYLVRLVTPKGGTVLDPFNGSGSTGKAVMYENKDRDADYKYIGIELTKEYIPIAMARIEYAAGEEEHEEETEVRQFTIFDYIAE